MTKKHRIDELKRAKSAAKRLPAHMQDIAFTKSTRLGQKKFNEGKMGKFGKASDVRSIDPSSIDLSAYGIVSKPGDAA